MNQIANLKPAVRSRNEETRAALRRSFMLLPPDMIPLVALLLIEALCFLPLAGKIGFYLDDWTKICNLHFADPSFVSWFWTSVMEPTMIPRPVQALYYAMAYGLCKDAPLGYHLLRCLIEAAGAGLLYLGLSRLSGNRLAAFLAAAIFLIYPTHDSTHYWIGAGVINVAIGLFLLSWWLAIRAARENRTYSLGSIVSFGLSAFCYESFLPLLGSLTLSVFLIYKKKQRWLKALGRAVITAVPYFVIAGCLVYYQRVFVYGRFESLLPPSSFQWPHFSQVMLKGSNISLGPSNWTFCLEQADLAIRAGLSGAELLRLSLLAATVFLTSLILVRRESATVFHGLSTLFIVGASTVLFSYTVFGCAIEYLPAIDSLYNRVNFGGAVGVALFLAAAFLLLAKALAIPMQKAGVTLALALLMLPVSFWVLVDWGMSKPWVSSWRVQKHITGLVQKMGPQLKPTDCLLLANAPRYVEWAPLFDGMWDFQAMARMTTGEKDFKAGVVTERMQLNDISVVDDFPLAQHKNVSYYFDSLYVLFPAQAELVRVDSASDFVRLISTKGMDFGLDRITIPRWQRQLQECTLRNAAKMREVR